MRRSSLIFRGDSVKKGRSNDEPESHYRAIDATWYLFTGTLTPRNIAANSEFGQPGSEDEIEGDPSRCCKSTATSSQLESR